MHAYVSLFFYTKHVKSYFCIFDILVSLKNVFILSVQIPPGKGISYLNMVQQRTFLK